MHRRPPAHPLRRPPRPTTCPEPTHPAVSNEKPPATEPGSVAGGFVVFDIFQVNANWLSKNRATVNTSNHPANNTACRDVNSHNDRPSCSWLINLQVSEPAKVRTGIRRCGTSSRLKLMVAHLKESGIAPEQIVEMNFESRDFRNITSDDVSCVCEEAHPWPGSVRDQSTDV